MSQKPCSVSSLAIHLKDTKTLMGLDLFDLLFLLQNVSFQISSIQIYALSGCVEGVVRHVQL